MTRATRPLLALAVLAACGGGDGAPASTPSTPSTPPAAPAPPAPAAAAMCAEHGVLEALCTRCHPALIAVFSAKGTYCEEHGFPELVCPVCHPERGGRPPEPLDLADDGPPDGIRVELASPEVAAVAGLRTVAAAPAPARAEVTAVATLAFDATRMARVGARAPGLIEAVHVEVGARVAPGALLAEIASADVGTSRAALDAARARLDLARRQAARLDTLGADGVTSARQIEEARAAVAEARADLAAVTASRAMIDPQDDRRYRVTSPIGGVVLRRAATVGAFVDAGDVLFEVVDTQVMWAAIEVPEAEVAQVTSGATLTLAVDALPGRSFDAVVHYIAPEVDAHSRTVLVRATVDNLDGLLRANMFARARLPGPAADAARDNAGKGRVLVPVGAVQAAKATRLVFVELAPDRYEGRRVVIVRTLEDGRVEVAGRLAQGDRVVVDGAFLLKTETLRDSIGAGCCAADAP